MRVAFVKFAGMAAGGTERWLQTMAVELSQLGVEVDYYFSDTAPLLGSSHGAAGTDSHRLEMMQRSSVRLVEFHVGAYDLTVPGAYWVDSDFFSVFDGSRYDLVQTAKSGGREYPFDRLDVPVVEYRVLQGPPDPSATIAWSIHLSQWQRSRWWAEGGRLEHSSVIPIPANVPATKEDLRARVGIEAGAIVCGFHQRSDPRTFSPIPLRAFATVADRDTHFVLMGGAAEYREQARKLRLRNVHFVDPVGSDEGVSRFLNTLDVFTHGRRDGETFGTVLAEAMTHGLPCLSHLSLGGANAQPETMGPGGVFATGRREYEQYMRRLIVDADFRNLLAVAGQGHAEARYTPAAAAVALLDVYSKVLGTTSPDVSASSEYGSSPLGCLVAGNVTNPNDVAHQVLTERLRNPVTTVLVRRLAQRLGGLVDAAPRSWGGGYAVAAVSPPCVSVEIVVRAETAPPVSETLRLNRWEHARTSDAPAANAISRSALVLLDEDEVRDDEREALLNAVARHRPVILARVGSRSLTPSLVTAGYSVLIYRDLGLAPNQFLLALPPGVPRGQGTRWLWAARTSARQLQLRATLRGARDAVVVRVADPERLWASLRYRTRFLRRS